MQAEKGDLNSMQITDVRVRKVTKERSEEHTSELQSPVQLV